MASVASADGNFPAGMGTSDTTKHWQDGVCLLGGREKTKEMLQGIFWL